MGDSDFLNDFRDLITREKQGHMGKHLYSGLGAEAWVRLKNDPSYPISHASQQLVEKYLEDIGERVSKNCEFIDLAPGDEDSVRFSMKIVKQLNTASYVIIENSPDFRKEAEAIAQEYFPPSKVNVILGDIFAPEFKTDEQAIIYLGGGTISNLIHKVDTEFPMDELKEKLAKLVYHAPRGWLLLTFDTTHDEAELNRRYGSQAAHDFACNVMYYAASEFPDIGLDPSKFKYEPQYKKSSRQYAHILIATEDQNCKFGHIEKGAEFHFASSYKIAPEWFEDAVKDIGYEPIMREQDKDGTILYLICPKAISRILPAS
jgi:uncharacterized SAM-dependent methyltransferase